MTRPFKKALRILVPLDFSAISRQAIPVARSLAASGAKVLLLNVVKPIYVSSMLGPESVATVYSRDMTMRELKKAEREAKHLAAELPAARGLAMESSNVVEAILRQARAFKADLLVMTSHGRGGLSRLLHGSVAQKLLAHYRGRIILLRPESKA
jgi:nucleotide-binding universal stress UspA family protein